MLGPDEVAADLPMGADAISPDALLPTPCARSSGMERQQALLLTKDRCWSG